MDGLPGEKGASGPPGPPGLPENYDVSIQFNFNASNSKPNLSFIPIGSIKFENKN